LGSNKKMKTTLKNEKHKVLESWVDQFADQLFSWAFHKTCSKETAEDLVQETFLAATKYFEKCKNKSQPKSWLFSILNNKVIDYFRKKATSFHLIQTPLEKERAQFVDGFYNQNDNWTSAGSALFSSEEEHLLDNPVFNGLLEKCLSDLPVKWRIAILSKYLLEKKSSEICKELEISPSNYWQVIHRAKLFLKACLEKYWKE